MALPEDSQTGEIACPVCTLALYYVCLEADGEMAPMLIRQGSMPVSDWRELCQCLQRRDSLSTVDAVLLLEEYRDTQ
ncbi:hypothetical protein LOC68_00550 [Blastopirellula sp. JC732]|uniref:Uncharacterized protein n=1 Tax=Blastopirellula sediminis TaxID=2894196 RepID=A0A9X1MGY7_9BACT|nr:hypothetical protein [Blastopirellula sediminis]MCC9604363.1 hypothetical protein [Blastopirellula sediminis]MCC9626883.1 hypothetical protein [Blastopirellula sediminis]